MPFNCMKYYLVYFSIIAATLYATQPAEMEWMSVFLDGQKIGYHSNSRKVRDSIIETIDCTNLSFIRKGKRIAVKKTVKYHETINGDPINFSIENIRNGAKCLARGDFLNSTIKLTTVANSITQERNISLPQETYFPSGFRGLQTQKGLELGTQYYMNIFDPELLSIVKTKIVIETSTQYALPHSSPIFTITIKPDLLTIPSTVILTNSSLNIYKKIVRIPGLDMIEVRSTRELATGPNYADDILLCSSIESPYKIFNPDKICEITYRIRWKENCRAYIPTDINQMVTKEKDGYSTITVKLREVIDVPSPILAAEALMSSEYIQSDNPEIIQLAQDIYKEEEKHPLKIADKITKFVHSHLDRDNITIGYASALETLNRKQGDCTEHALLTASLCRARGIPSRIAFGIVYSSPSDNSNTGVFTPHAWTEVLIEERWTLLDSTKEDVCPATYIKLVLSYSGDPTATYDLIALINNFDITHINPTYCPN